MGKVRSGFKAAWPVLAGSVLAAAIVAGQVRAQMPAVDPAAASALKRMTEYLGGLKQFSVHTQNAVEDLLDSGQRFDELVSADIVLSRPNKLRVERRGDLIDQIFYYDGKHLTLYEPDANVYATVDAPPTIEETVEFASSALGLNVPAADLIHPDAYPLLMQDVTSAIVIGKSVVGGVACTHLAFRRPGVDFQIWIADSGHPLPYRYVVTDTSTPALVSVVTVMSEWNVAPSVADDRYTFAPPQGASSIDFLSPGASAAASQ